MVWKIAAANASVGGTDAPPPTTHNDLIEVATKIDMSQPSYYKAQDSQTVQPPRPPKLQARRMSFPPPNSVSVDPMRGASRGTSSRMESFMRHVPTPGFKPPRQNQKD
ncbi:hypothetical protein PIB30_046538 [Stylosanthes scabra]|uniref:Uncharacterized protein n=1 Tax=Stylosanthes scabra TaxID=79078 RepID=A0ABU6SHP0_9FABA|nr:hypothetical protein [Stylosanthes scabra]